jgi:hypothetical protein
MNSIRKLLAIAAILALAMPAGAQESVPPAEQTVPGTEQVLPAVPLAPPTVDEVFLAYRNLVDHGRDRPFFGLPEMEIWRAPGPVLVALYADQDSSAALGAALEAVAGEFARATGLDIQLAMTRPLAALAGAEAARAATGANLEIVVGPRPMMAQMAGAFAVNDWMLGRFEDGRWPFLFSFPRDVSLIGRVMVAADEPPEAQEATLVLALAWALGAVTLGDQMEGLVDPFSVLPTLTPLGEAAFALMYHPRMVHGLPIPQALARAQVLLSQQ